MSQNTAQTTFFVRKYADLSEYLLLLTTISHCLESVSVPHNPFPLRRCHLTRTNNPHMYSGIGDTPVSNQDALRDSVSCVSHLPFKFSAVCCGFVPVSSFHLPLPSVLKSGTRLVTSIARLPPVFPCSGGGERFFLNERVSALSRGRFVSRTLCCGPPSGCWEWLSPVSANNKVHNM